MTDTPKVCKHGSLRRVCETCDLAEDVVRLERELAEARKDAKAMALWKLLDDIDTLDDSAKGNDAEFRRRCYIIQRKRFQIISGDQYDAIDAARREGK